MAGRSTKSSAHFSVSSPRPRAILFDWTGTIAEPAPGHFVERVADVLGAVSGVAIDPQDASRALRRHLMSMPPGGFDQSFQAILDDLGAGHVDAGLAAQAFVEAEFRGQRVYDDARAILASLRFRGFRTAIVSNLFIPGDLVRPALGNLGLANYFDVVVTSADTGLPKPDPSVFREALAALRLDSNEALVAGDSPETDIAGANAAGIPVVLVDRHGRYPGFNGAPVVESLAGLHSFLGEGVWPA